MFQWTERIKNYVGGIVGLVSMLIGYLMGITGKSPSPWPQATAVLIVLVSTLYLWGLWWPRISRLLELLLPKPPGQVSGFGKLIDPFRSHGHRSYALPLSRRRMEGGALFALTLGAVVLSIFRFPAVIVEIFPSVAPIPMNCVGDGSSQSVKVVIAKFMQVGEPLLLENRLFDLLAGQSKWMGKVRVCRTEEVVEDQSEAIELGKQAQAAIVIWGRADSALYEINFEIAEWDLPDIKLRSFPTPEAATPSFQLREPLRTSFLTQFVLSNLLYIRGDVLGARDLLGKALQFTHEQKLDEEPENYKHLASAYFLLGYLYDKDISSRPDLNQAIDHYSRAISFDKEFYSAYLNRGRTKQELGQDESAIADFELLASLSAASKPGMAATANLNLADMFVMSDPVRAEDYYAKAILLNPLLGYKHRGLIYLWTLDMPSRAVSDFSAALALNQKDPYIYHDLGQAQLLTGQADAALQTYQKAITDADWSPGNRDEFISDLRELLGDEPPLEQPINSIIRMLKSARLP